MDATQPTGVSVHAVRLHKRGRSYSIDLPADLLWSDPDQELWITRDGEVLTISPRMPSRPRRPQWTTAQMIDRLEELGPTQLSDSALERGEGRDYPELPR